MKNKIYDKPNFHHGQTIGERAADKLTRYAGSWHFILFFLAFLCVWMAINIIAWIRVWDPYPFILLNLVLSCLAAIQAPIILMSQNRQSQKDRIKAEYDYKVNRKAEKGVEDILRRIANLEEAILKRIK